MSGALRSRTTFVCCFIAGMCGMIDLLLFNGELFAAYDSLFAWSRDESTLVEAAVLLVLLLVARWRPSLIHPLAYTVTAVVFGCLGCVFCALGVNFGMTGLIIAGIVLVALCGAWNMVVWLLACSTLGMRRCCLCLAGSGILAVPLAFVLNAAAPYLVLSIIGALATVLIAPICLASTRPFFERLATVGIPAEQAIVRPRAFLPLGNTFYVYIFVFSLAYGFALRCESISSSEVMAGMTLLTLVAVTVYAWRVKDRPRIDALFVASLFVVLLGFMLILVNDSRIVGVASALLVAGYMCAELLIWFALCATAARTTADAIPAICWGNALGFLGIEAGVGLWLIPNGLLADTLQGDGLLQGLIVAAVLAFLVLYMFLTRRTFSFDATINGIEPDAPQITVRYVDALDEHCTDAVVRYALTAREAEVMRLLAHGNNTSHIQSELNIGYNTVKYHVKNIYAKLDVHSQQELIDKLSDPQGPDEHDQA